MTPQPKHEQIVRERLCLVVIATISLSVLFWRLGQGTFKDWDEAIYAEVAREMIRTGNWLTPMWGFQPWFHKPPLLIWLTAILFKVLGESEVWARVVPALSGVVTIGVTYLIGARLYGSTAGIAAALIPLTMDFFLKLARLAMMDMPLTLLYMLTIYDLIRWREGNPRSLVRISLWTALAIMLKSAAAGILPMAVLVAVAAERGRYELRKRELWFSLLVIVVVAAPWHGLMLARYGSQFVNEYIGYHVLARATSALEGNAGSSAYGLKVLVDGCFPWFALAVPAVLLVLVDASRGLKQAVPVLAGALIVPIVYTAVQTRLLHYIVPALPCLSVLIAGLLHAIATDERVRRAAYPLVLSSGAIAALLITVQQLGSVRYIWSTLISFSAAFILTGVLFRRRQRVILPWVLVVVFLFLGARRCAYNFQRSAHPVALIARHLPGRTGASAQSVLMVESDLYPSVLFYGNRLAQPISLADARKLCSAMPVELIVDTDHLKQLEQSCPVSERAVEAGMHYVVAP